jgi:hypothetical protein
LALFTTSPTRVHVRWDFPIPTLFRPQALAASRRFSPQVGLQAYFIPQPCSGPILFRGFFSPRSRTISSIVQIFPLAVEHQTTNRLPDRRHSVPRLRGFSPREGT